MMMNGYFTAHAVAWDEINIILDSVLDATLFFSVEDDEIIKIINEETEAFIVGRKR